MKRLVKITLMLVFVLLLFMFGYNKTLARYYEKLVLK